MKSTPRITRGTTSCHVYPRDHTRDDNHTKSIVRGHPGNNTMISSTFVLGEFPYANKQPYYPTLETSKNTSKYPQKIFELFMAHSQKKIKMLLMHESKSFQVKWHQISGGLWSSNLKESGVWLGHNLIQSMGNSPGFNFSSSRASKDFYGSDINFHD